MDHISKDSILTKTTGPDTISTCKHAQCFDELRGPPNVPQPYHKCVLIIRWTRNSGNVRLIRYLAYDGIQDGSEYTATLSSSPHHSEKKLRELNKCNKYINKVYIATDTRPYAAIPGVNSAKACLVSRYLRSSWNVMAHGYAREEKWMGNWRMDWVASTLHTTSEHGVSSITTADAHTSAASSRLNWRPRRFKWTRPFRWKTKSGFCACAITFLLASTTN